VLHHGQVTLDKPSPKGSTLQRCYDGPCCVGWSVSLADSGRKLEASDRDLKAKIREIHIFVSSNPRRNYFKSHCLHIMFAKISLQGSFRDISLPTIISEDHCKISSRKNHRQTIISEDPLRVILSWPYHFTYILRDISSKILCELYYL
jgi:hypothetical protein